MTARSLLSVLLLLLGSSCTVWCTTICNNRCCSFVEGFPARLKMLRENYSNIREYYVSTNSTVQQGSCWSIIWSWCPPDTHLSGDAACFPLLTARSPSLQAANDDLDMVLLDQSIVESFKVSSPSSSLVQISIESAQKRKGKESSSIPTCALLSHLFRRRLRATPWTASWSSTWTRFFPERWPASRRRPKTYSPMWSPSSRSLTSSRLKLPNVWVRAPSTA